MFLSDLAGLRHILSAQQEPDRERFDMGEVLCNVPRDKTSPIGKECNMLFRRTPVSLSILFQMQLRAAESALYLVAIFLFHSRLFYIGRINDIGLANGLLLFLLIIAQMVLLVFQSEGTNLYCDPVNVRNRGKYIGIILTELLLMGFPAVLWTVPVMSEKRQNAFWVLFWAAAIIILVTHMQMIKNYKQMPEQEIRALIADYKMQQKEELFEKSDAIRKKGYAFIGYMIGVTLLFRYLAYNVMTAVLFAGVNIAVMVSLFAKPLREFYKITEDGSVYLRVLIVGISVSTIGYVLVYLIWQDVIRIPFFYGRSADEMGMFYLLFYIPFLKDIEMCCTIENRMMRQWER